MSNNAVIYTRVSNIKQVTDGHGLEAQESMCRDYAESKNFEVIKVFREEGITGETDKRPALDEMMNFLKTSEMPLTVICDDISRLSRETMGYMKLKSRISQYGCSHDYVRFDLQDSPIGRFSECMMIANATFFREQNKERVTNCMTERAKKGFYQFSTPMGYEYQKHPEHGKMIVPKEPDASILKEAFERFADNRLFTISDFKNFLDDKRGKSIARNTARDLLKNKIYAGILEVKSFGVNVNGKHEPLISVQTFESIQNKLSEKGKKQTSKNREFPLRGIVKCSICKRKLTASRSKGRSAYYNYYHCQNRSCPEYGKTVNQDKLEREFMGLLTESRIHSSVMKAARITAKNIVKATRNQRKAVENKAHEELDNLKKTNDRLMEKLIWLESKEATKAVEEEISKNRLRCALLQEQLGDRKAPELKVGTMIHEATKFFETPDQLWFEGDFDFKQKLPLFFFDNDLTYDRNKGFETAQKSLPVRVLNDLGQGKVSMVDLNAETWNQFIEELNKVTKFICEPRAQYSCNQ